MFIKKNYFRYFILGTIVLTFIINAISFPFFDEVIAVHFDANGNVNGEFHKIIIFLLPILMLLILYVKDSQGNRIFKEENIMVEPYKVILCVVVAAICFFANLYIVLFNLNMVTMSVYYLLQIVIMLLIVALLSFAVYKKSCNKSYGKIILLNIGLCFGVQLLSIYFKHTILDWVSAGALLVVIIFAILEYTKR